eukprot:2950699-Prymnesium_polylepis.1
MWVRARRARTPRAHAARVQPPHPDRVSRAACALQPCCCTHSRGTAAPHRRTPAVTATAPHGAAARHRAPAAAALCRRPTPPPYAAALCRHTTGVPPTRRASTLRPWRPATFLSRWSWARVSASTPFSAARSHESPRAWATRPRCCPAVTWSPLDRSRRRVAVPPHQTAPSLPLTGWAL